MPRIVVLRDGETYSDINGCMVVEISDEQLEQIEECGDPRPVISQIMAKDSPGRIESIMALDDSMLRVRKVIEKVDHVFQTKPSHPLASPHQPPSDGVQLP